MSYSKTTCKNPNCLSKWFIIRFSFNPVVQCPTITTPRHGMVFPSLCKSILGVNYGTDCYFMCNVSLGYQLEGARNVSCLESGVWSADTTKIICRGILYRCLSLLFTVPVYFPDKARILSSRSLSCFMFH